MAQALASYKATYGETVQRLAAVEMALETERDEQAFWERIAMETEVAKLALRDRLATEQAGSAGRALDEAETRKLVDEQLCQARW